MPAFTTNTFVLYPQGIKAHFEPGGAVHHNANSVGDAAVRVAKIKVGVRTGLLKRTIHKVGRGAMAAYTYQITLRAETEYVLWHEKGTDGVFLGPGEWRKLKAWPPRFPRPTLFGNGRYLNGQRGRHFLRDGMNASLLEHGYGPLTNE